MYTKLTCSGSGVLFPMHLGAIAVLEKFNLIDLKTVSLRGVSGGSLALALLASGHTPYSAKDLVCNLNLKKMLKFNKKFWQPYNQMGLYSSTYLCQKYSDLLPTTFCDLKNHLSVFVTDVTETQPRLVTISPNENRHWTVSEAITASSAVPLIFTPIYKNEHIYVDGGVIDNLPVLDSQDEIAIYIHSFPQKSKNRRDILSSVINGLMFEPKTRTKIIQLDTEYEAFDFRNFGPKMINELFNKAYQDTIFQLLEYPNKTRR